MWDKLSPFTTSTQKNNREPERWGEKATEANGEVM